MMHHNAFEDVGASFQSALNVLPSHPDRREVALRQGVGQNLNYILRVASLDHEPWAVFGPQLELLEQKWYCSQPSCMFEEGIIGMITRAQALVWCLQTVFFQQIW